MCAGVMMIINCNWTFNHQDHCEASSPAQWQAKSGITGAHSSLRFGSSPSPGGKQCRQQKPFPSNHVSIWKGKEDAQVLSFKALNDKQRKEIARLMFSSVVDLRVTGSIFFSKVNSTFTSKQ